MGVYIYVPEGRQCWVKWSNITRREGSDAVEENVLAVLRRVRDPLQCVLIRPSGAKNVCRPNRHFTWKAGANERRHLLRMVSSPWRSDQFLWVSQDIKQVFLFFK